MKERPIFFSAPMVRAILEGRKAQTRRIVKSSINYLHSGGNPVQLLADWPLSKLLEFDPIAATAHFKVQCSVDDVDHEYAKCPYGQPGDRLWVRETWQPGARDIGMPEYAYRADGEVWYDGRWRASIHMPRVASRILLEITDIRVERLHEITEEDAIAEGEKYDVFLGDTPTAIVPFALRWQAIHGPESWDQNPWVWVITFKKYSYETQAPCFSIRPDREPESSHVQDFRTPRQRRPDRLCLSALQACLRRNVFAWILGGSPLLDG